MGTLMVSNGWASLAVALNFTPFSKTILLAVVEKNEPPMSRRALGPNIIPLGLSKNRLALPLAPINPSMLEMFPPVTRVIMLLMLAALLNNASLPVGTENSRKL